MSNDDISEYEHLLSNETEFYVVSDDDQPDTPTDIWGIWLAVIVFCAFIVFSCFAVFAIMYCSRAQERAKANDRQSQRQNQYEAQINALKGNLTVKPWCPDDHTTTTTTTSTYQTTTTPVSLSLPGCDGDTTVSSYHEDEDDDEERQQQRGGAVAVAVATATAVATTTPFPPGIIVADPALHSLSRSSPYTRIPTSLQQQQQQRDGLVCPICNEPYQPGQPVYQSNNPQCQHVCHKACMDMWLQCQNTCPICNQPFVVHVV